MIECETMFTLGSALIGFLLGMFTGALILLWSDAPPWDEE